MRQGRISCLQHTTKISDREGVSSNNIQQRYQAWQDILTTKFNNIKHGRMPFLNIQQRYQTGKDFFPTTYNKDIRHGRISCLQNSTISSMVGCPSSTYNKDIKDIKHCWISCLQHKTKISVMSGMTGFPANNIQEIYQAWQ